MKLIAQPESYSDMLERVFVTTIVSGIACTLILASASTAVKAFLDSVRTETDIGPIKGMKTLYVLIPIVIAVVSRIVLLHDKLSDLLHIRIIFDSRHILFPMARLSGHDVDKNMEQRIRSVRESAMYRVFYPYAGFATPAIDKQLIRTALDNWGWFWVGIESTFLFVVTGIIVAIVGGGIQFIICMVTLLVTGSLLWIKWLACRRSADRQVRAIIDHPQRKVDIQAYFATICKNPDGQPVRESAMAIADSSKPVTKKI